LLAKSAQITDNYLTTSSADTTKYVLMSFCQKAGHKHSIEIANRPFEGVAKFISGNNTNRSKLHA
jgi:hypothetical protein